MTEDQRTLALSEEEYALLCSILVLDEECVQLLQRAEHSTRSYRLLASSDELEGLQGFVASEANHEADPRRQERLDQLSDRLEAIIRP